MSTPGDSDVAGAPEANEPYVPHVGSFSGRLSDALKSADGDAALTGAPMHEPAAPDTPPEDELASAGPVGTGERVVREGECCSSIAKDSGHFWETLWNDPQNAELRMVRADPNVLLPADRMHVPALREKWEPGQTEVRHRFRRRGWPEMFRVRVLRDDEPRGNQPYTLLIDGQESAGVTDADGNLSRPIAPNARRAVLHVGAEPDVDRYEFTLGAIDPIDSISGVQGRLNNLGFDCGAIDGKWGPLSQAAMRKYQKKRDLAATGEPDPVTKRKLQEDYGC